MNNDLGSRLKRKRTLLNLLVRYKHVGNMDEAFTLAYNIARDELLRLLESNPVRLVIVVVKEVVHVVVRLFLKGLSLLVTDLFVSFCQEHANVP